jgi:hypothetical protein
MVSYCIIGPKSSIIRWFNPNMYEFQIIIYTFNSLARVLTTEIHFQADKKNKILGDNNEKIYLIKNIAIVAFWFLWGLQQHFRIHKWCLTIEMPELNVYK